MAYSSDHTPHEQSTSPAARRSKSRYDSLDIWRGIACLMVVADHAVFLKPHAAHPGMWASLNVALARIALRGWIGVPIFFVISGYCISATIDSHRRKGTSVGEYFSRRFRRIFPPYWVVLFGSAIIIGAIDIALSGRLTSRGSGLLRPWWFSPMQWLGSATLTEQWLFHVLDHGKGWWLGQAWTLAYEEQFYAVTGLLLFLCPRRYFFGAAVVTAGVAATVGAAQFLPFSVEGFFFDGKWFQFALGILLYYALKRGDTRAQGMSAAVFAAIVIAALSHWRALIDDRQTDAQAYLVAGLFSLAALGLYRRDAEIAGRPSLRPLRTCGVMCYSLYLVHLPIADVLRASLIALGIDATAVSPLISIPLCGIPAIWVAWRFHLAVETRFMSPATAAQVNEPIVLPSAALV